MIYAIVKPYLGHPEKVEITQAEFGTAKAARNSLFQALAIEEKMNLVLENYAEYESELLHITLHSALFSGRTWSEGNTDIQTVNRRLINLLTTTRLYLDQVKHNLTNIYGTNSPTVTTFKGLTSKEYDAELGYRVMEALRNFVQHRSLPITKLSRPIKRYDRGSKTLGKYTISPMLEVARIKQEGDFKASVLDELERLGMEFDVRIFVRDYIAALGRIHLGIRGLISEDIKKWEQIVADIYDKFYSVHDLERTPLAIAVVADNNLASEIVNLFVEEPLKRLHWLEAKNRWLGEYDSQIITTETEET